MPNNENNGMIEDFILDLIPSERFDYTKNVVEQAQKADMTTFKDSHKSKAVIHTYLAWQHEPGNQISIAIKKATIDTKNDLAKDFIDWLNKLFFD